MERQRGSHCHVTDRGRGKRLGFRTVRFGALPRIDGRGVFKTGKVIVIVIVMRWADPGRICSLLK